MSNPVHVQPISSNHVYPVQSLKTAFQAMIGAINPSNDTPISDFSSAYLTRQLSNAQACLDVLNTAFKDALTLSSPHLIAEATPHCPVDNGARPFMDLHKNGLLRGSNLG